MLSGWFIALLKEIGAIIGWAEVWDYWEWFKQSRWGKRVSAIIGGLLLSTCGWATGHSALMYFALGMVVGGILTRLTMGFIERPRALQVDWPMLSLQIPASVS